MAKKYLGGKVDVSLFGVTIPADFISDEGVVTTLTEGVREVPTMAGTFREPSGTYDEASVVFNVVLPSMVYVKNFLPDLYKVGTGGSPGRVEFGGNSCEVRDNTQVVVHYSCEPNSDDDVYIPNGSVVASMELTQNATDPVTVAVTVNATPDDETGLIAWLGAGSLTGETIWDAEAEEYVPVTS